MKKIFLLTIFILLLFPCNVKAQPIENPRTTYTDSEILALQQVALAEAENQGPLGMAYVMQTIINRTKSDLFKNTIKDVIEEPGQFSTASYYTKYEPNEESNKALDMLIYLENKGQMYFEVKRDYPTWHSRNLTYCFTYKSHVFYI